MLKHKYDDALLCFKKSAKINPKHASSHNAIARLSKIDERKIHSLLAYCRFLSLESESDRAKQNLESIKTIMKANIEKTGKEFININRDMPGDITTIGKQKENNFSVTDMTLSMKTALDFDKKIRKRQKWNNLLGNLRLFVRP